MRPLFLILFFLLSSFVQAQQAFLDTLQANLVAYKNTVAQEKVFLHTDKTVYLAGETLWFKAYVVKADSHQPLDLSKVLYAELLDESSKPVVQAMIDLQKGLGDGSLLIPPSMPSGMYTLRAYTAWMKNFDEAFYFQQPVQIVNTTRRPDWNSLQKKKTHFIQFFPEGGNMVEGLQTKLGFQLVDQYGQGADGEGYIIANAKDTVSRFRPLKFGIGSFDFKPERGVNYKAVVRLPGGDFLSANLPQVYTTGYVLQVVDAGKEVQVTAATTEAPEEPVYLLAHTRGDAKFASAKRIMNGKATWTIDKAKLGDGITSFTLFNAEQKPVCERLYFKRPVEGLNIDISSNAKTYDTRSKVSLSIKTQNNHGQPIEAQSSVSVFLLDSLQGLNQATIEEYFWLTSELKGDVESPGYYFSGDSKEVDAALDNLLLTQGWRRFGWEDVAAKGRRSFSFLPEYEGLVIRRRVTNRQTGEPAPDVLCFLSVPGEKFYIGNAVSNERGEVSFVAKNIYGPVELVTQPGGADRTFRVDLLNSYSEKYAANKLPPFRLSEGWKEQLANRHLALQVANAFTTEAMQLFQLPVKADTTLFYGVPDTHYALDDYRRFPSMEEVMREVVAEVRVAKEKDTFTYRVNNLPYHEHFTTNPLVLFDGIPVFNNNKIISFDPLKVKAIDVVARKFYWGNTVNNGIVSYTTYDGNLANFELDPSVVLMEYNGLQVKREFYSPSYDTAEKLHSREADKRNVLLWSPSVRTGEGGKKEIQFYTSDVPGRYAVRVEGLSSEGLFGSGYIVVEVK